VVSFDNALPLHRDRRVERFIAGSGVSYALRSAYITERIENCSAAVSVSARPAGCVLAMFGSWIFVAIFIST
jgi:hypothetical protein